MKKVMMIVEIVVYFVFYSLVCLSVLAIVYNCVKYNTIGKPLSVEIAAGRFGYDLLRIETPEGKQLMLRPPEDDSEIHFGQMSKMRLKGFFILGLLEPEIIEIEISPIPISTP